MYSYGLLYLPVSTYSLLCATQLAFNALFSFFLNSQKFTPFILNSLVLLTTSASLLALNADSDEQDSSSSTKISKRKYAIGFLTTLGASAAYALYLSLLQLSFQKILKAETFSSVLNMQIYPSFVATCGCIVGLFASGEWRGLGKEMNEYYQESKVSYVMTLVWTALTWQICSVGLLGLIFEVSSLFSNVISTLALPVIPILAVIFFHDKMNGLKVIAMVLAIWGFLSYIYQHYLDDLKHKAHKSDTEGLVNENGEKLSENLGSQSSLEQVQSHSEIRKRSYPAEVSREGSKDCRVVESVSNGVSETAFEIETTESSGVDKVSINGDEDRNIVPLVDVLNEEVHSKGEENTVQISEDEVLHGLVSSDLYSVDEASNNDDEDVVGARKTVSQVDVLEEQVHSHTEENTTQICEDEVKVHSHIEDNTTIICEDEVLNGLPSSELDTTTEVSDDEDVVGDRNTVPQVGVLKEEVHSHIEENTPQICEDEVLNGLTSSKLDTADDVSDDEDIVGARNNVPQVDVLKEEVHSHIEENTTQICENEVSNGSASSKLDTTKKVSNNHHTSPASNEERTDVEVADNTTEVSDDHYTSASNEQSADVEVEVADQQTIGGDGGNLIEATIVSSAVQIQTSLDEERSLSVLNENVGEKETETSLAIASDASSTNYEEERGITSNSSDVAVELISEVAELHSNEDVISREEISTSSLVLSTGAALLTHPSKAFIGAEDAYFVASQNWLGLADGVGQWSLEGINDGIYARELMKNCERIVSDSKGTLVNKPAEVLVKSVAETQLPGSSTILVAYFDGQTFHVANIGDSGFIIIRNGVVFKRASSMVHEFNFPLHIESGDNPTDLIEDYEIDLDEGDVIVTATDGLFDNLYEQEIASIVSKSLEDSSEPQEIAGLLAGRAQEVAQSSTPRTPFADAAKAAGYVGFTGGKLDDVIVIVSLVHNKSSS